MDAVMKARSNHRSSTMGSYADAWVAKSSRIEVSSPGRCTRCDARLSVYRRPDETQCAPCRAAGPVQGRPA